MLITWRSAVTLDALATVFMRLRRVFGAKAAPLGMLLLLIRLPQAGFLAPQLLRNGAHEMYPTNRVPAMPARRPGLPRRIAKAKLQFVPTLGSPKWPNWSTGTKN